MWLPIGVACVDHRSRKVRPLVDEPADQKERGLHIMPIQYLQQAQGPWIVGAIVVGEGQQARGGLKTGEGSAVDLRSRPHGLKSGPRSQAGDTGSA